MQRRARAKFATAPLAVRLAELRTPLEKSYRNSVYCASTIVQADGKMQSRYCGNRWCLVCGRIKTARAISAYLPIIQQWEDRYFVTLTVRNVSAEELPGTFDRIVKVLGAAGIAKAMKRTYGVKLVGVRKLECTYSPERKDYHPHVHMIVKSEEAALLVRDLWLKRFGDRAVIQAQDVKQCNDGALLELFKYFTKLTTKPAGKGRQYMPVEALDVIFRAMRGRRVWQAMGFRLPKAIEESIESEELETSSSEALRRVEETVYWEWHQDVGDWIDRETGDCLSGYEPSAAFREFVDTVERTSPTGIRQVDDVEEIGDGEIRRGRTGPAATVRPPADVYQVDDVEEIGDGEIRRGRTSPAAE